MICALPIALMTVRLLFLFGLSGLFILEGCGAGDDTAGTVPAQDAEKMEAVCDKAVSGCCITRENGGCPGMRCEGIGGHDAENRFYACADDMDTKDKCDAAGCEQKCKDNAHMPTADGGSTCVSYAFSPDGRHPNSCLLYSSCTAMEAKEGYISYLGNLPDGGATTPAP